MEDSVANVLFGLIGSAISGELMPESKKLQFNSEMLPELLRISLKHDVAQLVAFGLSKNGLIVGDDPNLVEFQGQMFSASIRYERLNLDAQKIYEVLEATKIPFIPLKGAVIRSIYPEPWLRTSCDIDILVKPDNLEAAINSLVDSLQFVRGEKGPHDVQLTSPSGNHIELHFDLVEDYVLSDADKILTTVWDNSAPIKSGCYRYKMTDEMFYFYHIAHMAKHFENGGCGIRPFVDLWLLDNLGDINREKRGHLLAKGNLLMFAENCSQLSSCWFKDRKLNTFLHKMENYILGGGVYGTSKNRVAVNQQKKGGKIGYIIGRIFIPYAKLKRYYPILEKHKLLMPIMQIRRWFMLLNPKIAKMAKREIKVNNSLDKATANEMKSFMDEMGL